MRAAVVENVQARLRARGGREERVAIEGNQLVLGEGERRRAVAIAELLGAWNLLPEDDRARRIEGALARARVPLLRKDDAKGRLITAWAAASVLGLLAIASVTWARGEAASADGRRQNIVPSAAPVPDASAVAALRRGTLCSAVRRRVLTGANFGIYDADGWIVEVWVAREDGKLGPDDPQIARLATPGGIASFDEELGKVAGTLTVGSLEPPPGSDATSRPGGALLSFGGGFAAAYVDPAHRARFVSLADRLYDASSAEMGAMWARCGELPWHDLGAWFRGTDTGAAVGAMLFTSGRYGEGGAVNATAASGAANTLGALVTRSRQVVDARAIEIGVTDLGGKVQTVKGAGTTIIFPLAGYTLASRSSRELAALLDRARP